jgi:hypothetical protein
MLNDPSERFTHALLMAIVFLLTGIKDKDLGPLVGLLHSMLIFAICGFWAIGLPYFRRGE